MFLGELLLLKSCWEHVSHFLVFAKRVCLVVECEVLKCNKIVVKIVVKMGTVSTNFQ
jgi:hypothetical protein